MTDAPSEQSTPAPADPFKAELEIVQSGFDADWYAQTYRCDIETYGAAGETPFDFYVNRGARMGHDPHAQFSELLYRSHNMDVMQLVAKSPDKFGYWHWVIYGYSEKNDRHAFERPMIENARAIYKALDLDFIAREYRPLARRYPHLADYYFSCVATEQISPSAWFSEEGYLAMHGDILPAIQKGKAISGFGHYIMSSEHENRPIISYDAFLQGKKKRKEEADSQATFLVLEQNLPGINALAAMAMLKSMEFYTDKLDISLSAPQGTGGLLVLVPNFLPEILFGGYMAFFDFLGALKAEHGLGLRLLVVNTGSDEQHYGNLLRMRLKQPKIVGLFEDITHFNTKTREVSVPQNYTVVSYCAELHYMAEPIAESLGRKPIFFIQEYEPDFHANTDMKTFTANAFLIPHVAVYNSDKLVEYFAKHTPVMKTLGPGYQYTSIENYVRPLELDEAEFTRRHQTSKRRRLILYGRPEAHAARNHFAMLVFALKKAVREGVFDGARWEFYSIGSLSHKGSIDLGRSYELKILPKMPKAEYEEFLLSGDIGISVITTPHPGIIHFQMAAYGLVTLTNLTDLRDQAWLAAQCANLIGVDLIPAAIAAGLARATREVEDPARRYKNAKGFNFREKAACVDQAVAKIGALATV